MSADKPQRKRPGRPPSPKSIVINEMVDKLLPIYRSLPSAFKNEFSMNHFGMAQSYVRRALWRYSLNALETITDLELEILLQDAFRGQREYFQRKGKKR